MPLPLPTVRMTWHDLLFLHWPVEPGRLAAALPPGLTLDTFEGRAWLGVVPFRMSGVTPRGLPPLPWLSTTPELNVRTYVRDASHAGVWFFSLDAASPVLVETARRTFHLPYRHASMSCRRRGEVVAYASHRTERGVPTAEFRARYGPTGPAIRAVPGSLEHWLTARYSLFARDRAGRLHRGDIVHAPWPLQPATAQIERNTMAAALLGEAPGEPALCHYAARLDVTASALVPLAQGPAETRP